MSMYKIYQQFNLGEKNLTHDCGNREEAIRIFDSCARIINPINLNPINLKTKEVNLTVFLYDPNKKLLAKKTLQIGEK